MKTPEVNIMASPHAVYGASSLASSGSGWRAITTPSRRKLRIAIVPNSKISPKRCTVSNAGKAASWLEIVWKTQVRSHHSKKGRIEVIAVLPSLKRVRHDTAHGDDSGPKEQGHPPGEPR